jgi:threonine synthase
MTMAVSKACEAGSRAVICASTGNTSASAAAYAARAGLRCIVLIPSGKNVALGKLAQASMHGAEVIRIDGNFDQALEMVLEISKVASDHAREFGESLPHRRTEDRRVRGVRSARRQWRRTLHCIPVGNAGNITAYWKGYTEWHRSRARGRRCRACGDFRRRAPRRSCAARASCTPRRSRPRSASAIPRAGQQALAARDESRRHDRRSDRRGDHRRVQVARIEGRRLLRAVVRRVGRGVCFKMAAAGTLEATRRELGVEEMNVVCVLDRPRAERPRLRDAMQPARPRACPRKRARCWSCLGLN